MGIRVLITRRHVPRVFATLAAAAVLASALSGCESLIPDRLRRFGSTCGKPSDCAGGICFRGRCASACQTSDECGAGVCIENVCQGADEDLDNDGLPNGVELQFGLDPDNTDSDGDGIDDQTEFGDDLGQPKDTNGDGQIDAAQSNIIDADGDCMVDAIDIAPDNGAISNLPTAAEVCAEGVCASLLDDFDVTCDPGATAADEQTGCIGCVCEPSAGASPAGYEADESLCDGLDNDCDGKTDELLLFDGLPIGAPCLDTQGSCALGGTQGVVECGPDLQPICSTGAGGSASLAVDETCNGLDDDCDGVIDNGYSFAGLDVGADCSACGSEPRTCADGSPPLPPTVTCDASGDAATCAELPYAPGFELLSSGRPEAVERWTATWSQPWASLVRFGGRAPGFDGMADRRTTWVLDASGGPSAWRRVTTQDGPPGRRDAALVSDVEGERVLLVGGTAGVTGARDVWTLTRTGTGATAAWGWADAGELSDATGDAIADLPTGVWGRTHGLVLGAGADRQLVVFGAGQPTGHWIGLNSDVGVNDWQQLGVAPGPPAAVSLTGDVACAAAPVGGGGVGVVLTRQAALDAAPSVYTVEQLSGVPVAVAATQTGLDVPAGAELHCVMDDKGALHVIVGAAPDGTSPAAHLSASPVPGAGGGWGLPFSPLPAGTNTVEALDRWRGVAGFDVATGQLVLGGGVRRTVGAAGVEREGRADVWSSAGDGAWTRLDQPAPRARIGHAHVDTGPGGRCIAGGLGASLPVEGSNTPAIEPIRSVWCIDDDGWQLRNATGPKYAFGVAAFDTAADRILLMGGMALPDEATLNGVTKLWRNGWAFDEANPDTDRPAPTSQAWALAPDTGALTDLGQGTIPALVAPAVALDLLGNRAIVFGGYDADANQADLWTVDLATATWTLHADQTPADKPLPSYGSLFVYDEVRDAVLLIGGVVREVKPDGPDGAVFQVVANVDNIDACTGAKYELAWTAKPADPLVWQPLAMPAFADLDAPSPDEPLMRLWAGGPAFVPILFDQVGSSGLTAVPERPRTVATDENGAPCPGSTQPAWSDTSVVLDVALGVCATGVEPLLGTRALAPMPAHFLLATSTWQRSTRASTLYGGLDDDDLADGRLWQVARSCAVTGGP